MKNIKKLWFGLVFAIVSVTTLAGASEKENLLRELGQFIQTQEECSMKLHASIGRVYGGNRVIGVATGNHASAVKVFDPTLEGVVLQLETENDVGIVSLEFSSLELGIPGIWGEEQVRQHGVKLRTTDKTGQSKSQHAYGEITPVREDGKLTGLSLEVWTQSMTLAGYGPYDQKVLTMNCSVN